MHCNAAAQHFHFIPIQFHALPPALQHLHFTGMHKFWTQLKKIYFVAFLSELENSKEITVLINNQFT